MQGSARILKPSNLSKGQFKECYEFAKRNDYNVICEYIDRALTGTTDKHPDFLRMIEDSKEKAFKYVLVYQLDRFARNRYDSATYKAKLKKSGVRVLSAKENIIEDASGILLRACLKVWQNIIRLSFHKR